MSLHKISKNVVSWNVHITEAGCTWEITRQKSLWPAPVSVLLVKGLSFSSLILNFLIKILVHWYLSPGGILQGFVVQFDLY